MRAASQRFEDRKGFAAEIAYITFKPTNQHQRGYGGQAGFVAYKIRRSVYSRLSSTALRGTITWRAAGITSNVAGVCAIGSPSA